MNKWRVKENPYWQKMLDVVDGEGRGVAYFQRESDAARCVEAVNEAKRLREALEEANLVISRYSQQLAAMAKGE